MNYYNPYFYTIPNTFTTPRIGLFRRLFGSTGITFGGIIDRTQKFLNFANQAIPLVKQVKPIVGNAKTMFKVMNEFKKVERPNKRNTTVNKNVTDNITNTDNSDNNSAVMNGPTFFQ